MKKITLLAAFLICAVGFSQTNVSALGENNPQILGEVELRGNSCDATNPSNAFENGRGCSVNNMWVAANDFIVPAGNDASLTKILPNVFMSIGATATTVDVTVYNNSGGLPGAAISTQVGIVPTSQTVIGSNFGLDISTIELDLAPVVMPGDATNDVAYWVAIQVTTSDGGNAFWEDSTASLIGEGLGFSGDNGATWEIPAPAQDGVYTYEADCEPILSVGDNLAELVDIFPNPASDILQVRVPGSINVNSVALYDVLGKNTGAVLVNGEINVSQLARGVYILNVNTDSGTLTQKIVKQ